MPDRRTVEEGLSFVLTFYTTPYDRKIRPPGMHRLSKLLILKNGSKTRVAVKTLPPYRRVG